MRKSILAFLILTACGNLGRVGRSPEFAAMPSSPAENGVYSTLPANADDRGPTEQSSLWTAQRSSLLGDHRASARGDILTVVVEINDQATINDSTGRSRTASDKVGMPSLFGIPQRLDAAVLPDGASSGDLVSVNSA
jgi:flagellar L-ring protein precursor FlgH